ncbi:MAG TPA: DivIVA domain-containing protein [Actinomycetota bacterium]|nr:DivIVA domain-containing protein [Actinomycetota bacterium]
MLTPREIQEKQFHDAFRGYNHEEVDLFIDQVAEAYETLFKENQNFNRRLEELQEQLRNGPAPTAASLPAAPRSESEDMLKRMLVTAQETADKAVANARAKAQMLVEEAEIKARRIEEQADAVSSTTLQDAQRRARDMLQTAQQEEAELRDRIEGLKSFERDFRMRLTAFIRSQLELLETKPMVSAGSTGPVTSPFFDRSKLLSETIEKFGDYGLPKPLDRSPAPLELEPAQEPARLDEPSVSDWLSSISGSTAATEAGAEPAQQEESGDWSLGSGSTTPEPDSEPEREVSVGAPTVASSEEPEQPKPRQSAETKSIHELFWGED